MTKNQKKRLKKKLKKKQELMTKEESVISDVDAIPIATDGSNEGEEVMEVEEPDQAPANGTDAFDLTGPVSVKIADLGNACWTVREQGYRSLL